MRQFAESISFMNGQHFERFTVSKSLDTVVGLQNKILLWRILSTFAEIINYSGAVISYAVIAIPIFSGVLDDKSPAEISEIISKNTFLCLYLINSFTVITSLADSFSEIAGYTARLGDLIDLLLVDDTRKPLVSQYQEASTKPNGKLESKIQRLSAARMSLQLP